MTTNNDERLINFVDELAQEIRRVDGKHDKGAAALAEALMPFLSEHCRPAMPVDAMQVIQQAVNEIDRPEGLTDRQWEYVKGGIRLLVSQVNDVIARRRIEGDGV